MRRRRAGPSPAAVPARPRTAGVVPVAGDPLAGVERTVIDGTNLLHALARGARGPIPAPPAAIIARLRAAFPSSVTVDLVFDGPAAGGPTGRLASGIRVTYSGRLSADRVIDDGVAAQLAADGPASTWKILVVSDDRGLREAVAAKGARTAGSAWLAGRLARSATAPPRWNVDAGAGRPGSAAAGPRQRGFPGPPAPRAGTTIGHRRRPRTTGPEQRD